MRRLVSLMLCVIMILSCCIVQTSAVAEVNLKPYIARTLVVNEVEMGKTENRASGLITSYNLDLSVSGSTLNIRAGTYCIPDVVKCGFKNLVVQRRLATSATWSDYYDYGNLYNETYGASITTTHVVPSGYQYRLSCKHYAKKSLLVKQSVSNTSNVVGV